jgi:DNA polymerase-3 subunit delta
LVVKRFFSNKASLLALAADYLEGRKDVDMIFWEDKKSDKRSKLYKLIKKTGTVREFENKKGAVLRSWLTKKVEDSGYKITPRIAEDIIFRAGENQAMLDNELDKIFTYLDFKKSKEVTDEMLQLISESAEANIWNFIDRMVAGDHKKVLTELETLVKDKQHYIMTLGMITRQLRIMAQVKELMTTDEKGLNSLGMHPFVLEKTKRAVSKFTMEKIGQLYKRLVGLDLSIKEGKIEEKLGLSLYVLSF